MNKNAPNRLFVITNNTHLKVIKYYLKSYPIGNNFVILTITPFENHKSLINEIKNDEAFNLIATYINNQNAKFPITYLNLCKHFLQIRNLNLSNYNFSKVLFSNYNSWLQHLILKESNVIKPVLISDGTAIFKYLTLRKETTKAPLKLNAFVSEYLFKIKPYDKIHFYSPLDLLTYNNDSLEVFDFEKTPNYNLNYNLIYFVDSPLVERNFICLEIKLKFLKRIKEAFPNKKFIYYAHRRESSHNLQKYEFFGEIRRDTIPFEERFYKEDSLPFMVISFISSILINLPRLYPDIEFRFVKLNSEDILDNNFKNTYNELINDFGQVQSKNLFQLDIKA